jgi:hypothetical protein
VICLGQQKMQEMTLCHLHAYTSPGLEIFHYLLDLYFYCKKEAMLTCYRMREHMEQNNHQLIRRQTNLDKITQANQLTN